MENLLENDSTFELFTSSNDGNMFRNRVLTTMPSEKSSFQVYLGFQGDEDDKKTDEDADKNKPKREYDPEKIAQGVSATASAVSSIGSTVQAFKGDGTRPKSRRKQLKEVCGRKPIFGKQKKGYSKCVAEYNAGKIGTQTNTKTADDMPPPPPPTPPKDNTKIIVGSVIVVAILVTAFIGYKKGWFGVKA